MTVVEPGPVSKGLVERVKAILLRPSPTWDVIAVEPATTRSLFTGYAMILAAIPPVAGLIGALLFPAGLFGIVWRPNPLGLVIYAAVQYALSLASVFVLGLVIDALAPSFDGTKDKVQALKVAVYAATASWVAGVFALVPAIAALGWLLGLYSLYLLYLGLPRVMKAPAEKALGYTVVTIVVAVVLWLVCAAIAGSVLSASMMMSGVLASRGAATGQVSLPGGASVDIAKLEAASRQAERALQNGQATVTPIDVAVLTAALPAAVAGYQRGEVSSATSGVGGISGSNAEAYYSKGDARMNLAITDLGGAGALAGIAGALNVNASNESGGRYEKVGTVNGRMTSEIFDRNNGHGEYSVLVGQRLIVKAEGEGVSMNDLKAAVAAVDPGRLEALAKGG